MPKFKFEAHKLEEILNEYAEIREVEVPKAVLINGRLLAKELARRTQPFGTKREAAAFRTGHDIRKIIKDDDHLAEMIDKVYNERIKERLENMLRARNYEGIKQVFRKIGFLNKYGEMQVLNDFRSTHQSHRNATTGRTRKNADMLYIAQGDLPGYVEETATAWASPRRAGPWPQKTSRPPWQTSGAPTTFRLRKSKHLARQRLGAGQHLQPLFAHRHAHQLHPVDRPHLPGDRADECGKRGDCKNENPDGGDFEKAQEG
jgi:hypothetical protein